MAIQESTREGLTRQAFLRRAGAASVLSLSLPAFLAACGEDEGSTTSGSTGGATGPVSFLNSLEPGSPLTEGFETLESRWDKAHRSEKVTFASAPFATFLAAATTRARARKLQDTVQMLSGQAYSALFPALLELDKASFGDAGNELTGWGGQVISADKPDLYAGVPMGSVGIIWYYNREHVEKAGFDPETPFKSWDEFTALAKGLKAKGMTPIGMSGADSYFAWWMWIAFSPQVFPTQEDVLGVLAGDTPLTAPEFLDTLKPIEETYKEGWWNDNFADAAYSDVESQFSKGEVSMVPGLTTDIANWRIWDETLGPDKYGIAVAPQLPVADARGMYYTPSQSLGISKDTDVEGTAREWCMFLTSKETQTELLKVAGQLPNRTDIDVGKVTGSKGAGQIAALVKEYDGGIDSAQNQFNSGATNTAYTKLTSAITSGDLEGFLKELQRQQEQ